MKTLRAIYWAVFALALGLYAVMVSTTLPEISHAAGGLTPFDLRPTGYSVEEARQFLSALNGEGRETYLGQQAALDRIYPAALAFVLSGAVWVLFRSWVLRTMLIVASCVGMVFDYAENAKVAAMLNEPGLVGVDTVQAASTATVIKSVSTACVMVAVLVALGVAGAKWWRAR